MKTLKFRLLGAALVAFTMMSFAMMPMDSEPSTIAVAAADKNGEWVISGDEIIDGVWYWQRTCVAGNKVACVLGSVTRKKKKKSELAFQFDI